ncbi:hypothetical protein IL306_011361 [Fusarium sp. DS 682]|nr:hypothetical protein IL306_011361 [Fusarium sp. DS 682]
MSVLFVLIYILKGDSIRQCLSKRLRDEDAAFLELFSRLLIGQESCAEEVSTALEKGIKLEWENAYDVVNPFGDRRGRAFNSVWTFDLDKDVIFLTKDDRLFSAPLRLARERLLTPDDFEPVNTPTQIHAEEQTIPAPYWNPQVDIDPRRKAFLGRMLSDFGHTWRHILRREINDVTFMKLAYATVWISSMDFIIMERTGFEHVGGRGGVYVWVQDLPSWDTPKANIVRVGSCWFVLAQDLRNGLDMIRHHMENCAGSATSTARYAIMTLRQIVCCKVHDGELVCTRPESLFGDAPPSGYVIDLILWASDEPQEPKPSRLNYLPVEIQDKILLATTISSVATGKLGIELDLGSPFSWLEGGRKIGLEESKRHRTEASPIESQIFFNGALGGLSYKRELAPRVFRVDMSSLPVPPRPKFPPS